MNLLLLLLGKERVLALNSVTSCRLITVSSGNRKPRISHGTERSAAPLATDVLEISTCEATFSHDCKYEELP